jgi:hypothetical protein
MKITAEIKLDKLLCTKSQEDVDEPYLWAFYFKLDGTNVKQNPNNLLVPDSSVIIVTPAGSGGNLGGTISSGQSLNVPSSVGTYSTVLSDIVLINIPLVPGGKLIIPGMIGCLFALVEEDAVPRHAMEDAHQAVRTFFEKEINNFIQSLNLINLAGEAAKLPPGTNPPSPEQVKTYLTNKVDELQKKLRPALKTLITKTVITSISNAGELIDFMLNPDADDSLGNATLFATVPDIIGKSLKLPFGYNFKKDGEYDYTLSGYVSLFLSPQSPELHHESTVLSTSVIDSGQGIITDSLCLKEPIPVTWTKTANDEFEDIWWDFTSGTLRWTIEGTQITEGETASSGTINPHVDTWQPVFNGSAPPNCFSYNFLKQNVTVSYQLSRNNGVPHLKLYNTPSDGVYSLLVGVELMLPDKTAIPVDQISIEFDGNAINIPDDIKQSLEKCHNTDKARRAILNKMATRVHRVTPKEIWGPYYRHTAYTQAVSKLNEMVSNNEITAAAANELTLLISQKLNLTQPENITVVVPGQILQQL